MDRELLINSFALLLLLVAGLFFISYAIRHFRNRAPELGITSKAAQVALSETILPAGILGMDAGKIMGEKYPFTSAVLFFGVAVFLFAMQLPFASAGFALFSLIMVIGTLLQRNVPGYDKHSWQSQASLGSILLLALGLIVYQSLPLFQN